MRNIWKKDETFKMTLQYDNSVLFTGLKLYVQFLFGLLGFFLIGSEGNQQKARNAPSRGLFVPKTLVGGFGCLELVLYGIRELA